MIEVPGAAIEESHTKVCKHCGARILVGQVLDLSSTMKWRNFTLPGTERDGRLFFRRHLCKTANPP